MKKLLSLVVLIYTVSLSASIDSMQIFPEPKGPGATRFSSDRTYEHKIFQTDEECEAARREYPGFNCSQWIDFSTDGRVTMIVTDIANLGIYNIVGNKVFLQFKDGELPGQVTFNLSADESSLTEETTGTVWNLQR